MSIDSSGAIVASVGETVSHGTSLKVGRPDSMR